MSETFRVCLCVDASVVQELSSLLQEEGIAQVYVPNPQALVNYKASTDLVYLLDTANLLKMNPADAYALFRSIASSPLLLVYRSSELSQVENLIKDPQLSFDLLPLEHLQSWILVRMLKQAMQRKSNVRFAIDVAQISSWDWDLGSGEVIWTPGSTGQAEKLATHEFKSRIPPEDLPRIEEAAKQALAYKNDLSIEIRIVTPDGGIRWSLVKARAFYDDAELPIRMAGIAMDITDKKRVEEELKEAKESAERANEAKSVFLANMSHEIRTPLNAIMGFAELVQNSRLSPEKQRDFIRTITRNGKLLQQLLDDILDLSKVEASRMEVEHIRCSLPEIVTDVIKLIGKQAADKGIYLRVTSDFGLPETFMSDPVRLKQILINIVGNAVKFTQQGGVHVNITSKSTARGLPIDIVFSVMDTGPGIEPLQQSRLFMAFSQADASVARNFGGTGLGLILSRRLAQLLGGTVDLVYSNPGFGSTFRVSVQARDAQGSWRLMGENEQRDLIHAPSSIDLGLENERLLEGISVLIVEDAPDSRALASQILAQYGATIALAENGLEAVVILRDHEFDVVLMDLHMPLLDGFDATAKLRASGYQRPILAVSAAAMKDEKVRAFEVGCNDHLTKPFSIGILLEKIVGYARNQLPPPIAHGAISSSPCPNQALM